MLGTDKMELTARPLSMLRRLLALFRLRPFDTATEAGRSKERLRRAGLTTLSSGAARGVGILASLITVPLTYRYLGPEQYGLWMVLASIIAAMGFADLGIGLGLVNAISEAHGKDDRELARQYFTSAFGMLLTVAVLLAVAGAIAYPFVPWMRLFNVKSPAVAAEGARALLVLYAWFIINIPLDVASRVQTGFQKGYVPQMIRMAGSVATLVALLVVIALHGSLAWLVFGSTVGSIVSTIVNVWVLFYHDPWLIPALHAFHFGAAKKILRLGLMFFVLQCCVVAAYTSDNIVITQIMGAAAVAAYAVPRKLFAFPLAIVGMAINSLWPAYGEAISRGDVSWVRRTFIGSLWLVLGITVPSCIFLVTAGPWILRVFFGKSLSVSMSLLVVLAVWAVVDMVSTAVAIMMNGIGILRIQMFVAPPVSIINLALSIYLTRYFGLVGVCMGSIIAQSCLTLPIYWVVIRRRFRTMNESSLTERLQQLSSLR